MQASPYEIAIIGAGPSGLMAAEVLAEAGCRVSIYDRMPSPARKFLMAGRGGLNLTHSEQYSDFLSRYGEAAEWLAPYIHAFSPPDLRDWCEGLGQETFIGTSGRVFPKAMKAAGLLRAWLRRLDGYGVTFHPRHQWHGWKDGALHLTDMANGQEVLLRPDATLLALGGASWPRLGSDGGWAGVLELAGVEVSPLRPANCGFGVGWTEYFRGRFAGEPVKPVAVSHAGMVRQGEAVITASGIEGGVIYALSSSIRTGIETAEETLITLDLRPNMPVEALAKKLEAPRGNKSLSTHLRRAGFSPLASALLHEVTPKAELAAMDAPALAARLKALPLILRGTSGIERAISSAGGIRRDAVDENLMLLAQPGVFVAGEMLDWEAPTGGYLLQGCYSTAVAAAQGMLRHCHGRTHRLLSPRLV